MTAAKSAPDQTDMAFAPGDRVAVLLPLPLAGPYDYLVPEDSPPLKAGDLVAAPLGARQVMGCLWGAGDGQVEAKKLRPLIGPVPGGPSLPKESRAFVDWAAAYCLAAPGAVLKMVLPLPTAYDPPKTKPGVRMGYEALDPLKVTKARQRVLDVMADAPPLPVSLLAQEAGVGTGVVKGLMELGALAPHPILPPAPPQPQGDHPGPVLSSGQAEAAERLAEAVRESGFQALVLEGVTGSGKTEVYFEMVAEALKSGGQALVLLPEIGLTAQWLTRFEARFGAPPTVWHSELTQAQRRESLRAICQGEAKVVVGARSALFLPYPALRAIVVDEEHEAAFKQEDGVIYHGRDMAVARAHLGRIPIALASATPSLESLANVKTGRYERLVLPERHGGAKLPKIDLIDMRANAPTKETWGPSWLSPPLIEEVRQTLERGEQALLFLNRRGYAPLTLCRTCGHRLQCPQCSAWLVEHRRTGRLQCHHCGHSEPIPHVCPECEDTDSLVACGPGIERLAEEAVRRFPEASTAVVASDTVRTPSQAAELAHQVQEGQIQLLIGTQMLAKGHHFPNLTMVGVVDADMGLAGGDLRAGERTYQLLSQVAGRAGRAEKPGRVLIQTYAPDNPVMQAIQAQDQAGFMESQDRVRDLAGWPPYGRLAALIVSGRDPAQVDKVAGDLGRSGPYGQSMTTLGPAPAPLALLRGKHRRRLLLKTAKEVKIQSVLKDWLGRVQIPNSVRVQVDIDPYSFM